MMRSTAFQFTLMLACILHISRVAATAASIKRLSLHHGSPIDIETDFSKLASKYMDSRNFKSKKRPTNLGNLPSDAGLSLLEIASSIRPAEPRNHSALFEYE